MTKEAWDEMMEKEIENFENTVEVEALEYYARTGLIKDVDFEVAL